jgi:hypothetical protein
MAAEHGQIRTDLARERDDAFGRMTLDRKSVV